jgi:hypothetical protein
VFVLDDFAHRQTGAQRHILQGKPAPSPEDSKPATQVALVHHRASPFWGRRRGCGTLTRIAGTRLDGGVDGKKLCICTLIMVIGHPPDE